MPNAPKTPARAVRVGDGLWRAAQVVASRHGETVTDAIRRGLSDYVRRELRTLDIHRRPDMAINHSRRPELNRCDTCGADRPEYYRGSVAVLVCTDDALGMLTAHQPR